MKPTLHPQVNLEMETLLKEVFQSLPWVLEADGSLNKRLLSSLLNSQNPSPNDVAQLESLLKALLEPPQLKALFFYDVAGIPVFRKETFCHVFENQAFLPSSYTAYANHIGLRVWGQHLRDIQDVVLDFPYKDCVLEGGQTKEDQKGREVFYNEVLAPSAISRLTRPKAFNKVEYWHKPADGDACISQIPPP